MSHLVQQAFGREDVNLYEDVLKVAKDCSLAALRKAYYKQALLFHPDKNGDSETAKLKFQAISWTYSFLKCPEKRSDYDKYGSLPSEDDETAGEEGSDQWKSYFDTIFGKVSVGKINEFALKYKMSKEEEDDVLSNYEKFRGDLAKMLEFVMLSDENDLCRWNEDYIAPAISSKKVKDYSETSNKVLKRVQAKLAKEINMNQAEDSDRTETEGSDEEGTKKRGKTVTRKKPVPKKARPTKAKTSAGDDDLIAAIRNRGAGGNPFASLGARYGVSMDDVDPLDDDTFTRLQSKYKRKK